MGISFHSTPANPAEVLGAADRSVLVVYSDERLLRANVIFDESLRRALAAKPGEPIECTSEYMDEVRYPALYRERTLEFLLAKYGDRPPGVLVAFGWPSLEFCSRFRSRLFPQSTLLFAAIDVEAPLPVTPGTPITGVRSSFDGPATLRLALQLHPGTQQVFVVADPIPREGGRTSQGWSDFRESDFSARFVHLPIRPVSQLLDGLAQLPDHSVVIYLPAFGNGVSTDVPAHTLVEQMARVSRAPIYAALDAFLGYGIVGAVTATTDAIANETATLVVDVLASRRDADLPAVRTLPATPIFDYRQMQRWGVNAKQLPPGSVVLFAPPSPWKQYAKWVGAATALFLVQSGLILALVLQSVRRRRAEHEALRRRQELAHTTRVATMGELTASLAHEINQPLAAILSNAQAAQRLLAAGIATEAEIGEILADIAADDQRAGEVIRRMRALLRKEVSEPTTLDVNDLVAEVTALVHGEMILQSVSLALELGPAPLRVHGDRIQLQQVLLNLMMNAMDAMKETSTGERKLTIRTEAVPDHAVRISVADSGTGVAGDALERVFDRFVTTKPHGMGLGLSICRSIVEAHGGRVRATNNPSVGATFWFELPAAEEMKR